MSTVTEKPSYIIDDQDTKDGLWRDGVFHKPLYSVMRNGEPITVDGDLMTSNPYKIAYDIKVHLEAVTDDSYTLEVSGWHAIEDVNYTMPNETAPASNIFNSYPKSQFDKWD